MSQSQFRGRNFNLRAMPTAAVGTDERHSPPQPVQSQVPRPSRSSVIDCSGNSFSTYLAREDERIRRVENQRADAHEILIFAALLAATVATLIGASIRGLQLDPLDKWAFYLAKTSELLADIKEPHDSLPSATLIDPAKFNPPTSIILINSFWFLSLAVSLTCILMASLMQRWAYQYSISIFARSRIESINSAELRAPVGFEDDLRLPWLIEALPTLLRIALGLFFAGFGVFVFNLTSEFGTAPAFLLTTGSLICPIFCFWQT